MTLEELLKVQHDRGLTDVHLVYMDDLGFCIAHTRAERNAVANGEMDSLEACPLHVALDELGMAVEGFEEKVVVAVAVPHDPVSQSFRSDDTGWGFTPVEDYMP